MTDKTIDHDPLYLQALEESAAHWLDGVNRTEENYLRFPMDSGHCVVCMYHGQPKGEWHIILEKCFPCFLNDGNCAVEFRNAQKAKIGRNFKDFHAYALALYGRICAELKRVRWIHFGIDIAKKPEQSVHKKWEKAKTTVTVWGAFSSDTAQSGVHLGGKFKDYIKKSSYSFSGTPNIDRIIAETLEKALAVKVECTEKFVFDDCIAIQCYIWSKQLGKIHGCTWEYRDYYASYKSVIDANIEAAITAYLSKEQPKSEHMAGEHFNEDWDYAGIMKYPEGNDTYVSAYDYVPVNLKAGKKFVDKSVNNGLREILVPRKKEPFKVGDIRDIGGGVMVWAEDDGEEKYPIILRFNTRTVRCFQRKEGEAICAALHIPIREVGE